MNLCFIDIIVLIYNQRTVFDVICWKRIFYSKITLFISIFFFFLENSTNLLLVIVQQIKRSKLYKILKIKYSLIYNSTGKIVRARKYFSRTTKAIERRGTFMPLYLLH